MEEANTADRIALLDAGRLVAVDTPQRLRSLQGAILLTTANDAQTCDWLRRRGYAPTVQANGIRLCCTDRAAELPQLLRDIPVPVLRVELPDTGLEAAFLQLTGRRPQGQDIPTWAEVA
jgi:ABC-2 type transport system ATP-binding protein